jgi:hypothetical protein
LFGIKEITPGDGAATGDGSGMSSLVTGSLHHHYATNSTGGPVVVEMVPTTVTASAILDDGTASMVAVNTDGTFSFPVAFAGQRYQLKLTTGDASFVLEHTSASLPITFSVPGRPNAQRAAVTQSTPVHFSITGVGAGTPVVVASTGLWTTSQTINPTSSIVAIDWQTQPSLGGRIGLLDATQGDQLFVTTWAQGAQYLAMTGVYKTAVTLIDGGNNNIGGNLQGVVPAQCVRVQTQFAAAHAALAAADPAATTSTGAWFLGDIPSIETGPYGNNQLASFAETLPGTDADLDVSYFDPYGGVVVATSIIIVGRTVTAPGATSTAQALSSMRFDTPITVDQACNPIALPLSGALASRPSVAGVELTTDGEQIGLPASGQVTVTWSEGQSGPRDLWTAEVYEVVNSGGSTQLVPGPAVATIDTTAHFDASVFQSGHAYYVQIASVTGYPRFATGESAVTLPYSYAALASNTFVAR